MATAKTKFTIITVLAAILAVAAGITLKVKSDTLTQGYMIAYGFIMIASLLTAVRGFRYLMSLKK